MASKIAHFPTVRDLSGFDFSAQPSIDPGQIRDLAVCRWIAHGDTLLLLGPPRCGQDASGHCARPRSHPRRILGAVRRRPGLGRRPRQGSS